MISRWVTGVVFTGVLAAAGDIRGTVTIERKLTRRNVTPSAGLYQRGVTVRLAADQLDDPLAFERSHVVVYLEEGIPSVPQPSLATPRVMEQRDRRFVPDLLVIPAGASVTFPNFDPVFHNVFSLSKAKSFDLGNYPKGASRTLTFSSPGVVAVYCHLHPNMSASIVVAPSSFAGRTDSEGNVVLKDVPPGKYTVVAWHKTAGTFRKSIIVDGSGADVNFIVPYVEPGGVHDTAHR